MYILFIGVLDLIFPWLTGIFIPPCTIHMQVATTHLCAHTYTPTRVKILLQWKSSL